jgi:hypothetical protein
VNALTNPNFASHVLNGGSRYAHAVTVDGGG